MTHRVSKGFCFSQLAHHFTAHPSVLSSTHLPTLQSTMTFLFLITILSFCSLTTGYVDFPSSCLGEENGYKWIKPLEGDDYPPIYQKCDKEYMIIDLNLDDNVQQYFSSMDSWHYALSGSYSHITHCDSLCF